MSLLSTAFLYNLLCGLVPCDFVHNQPGASIQEHLYTNRTHKGERILKNPYPVVETDDGSLRGYSMGSIQGNQIFAFEGVRYGETTGFSNRFQAPVPSKPWKGIRPAFKTGPACLQIHPLFVFRVIGSEDCLFMNIYTTNLKNLDEDVPQKLLPVIIFLHGGSFVFGEAAEYGPSYIVDQNLLLVTVNYRLGVMGFMSTGDEESPGNNGLRDQALAMKWIHENIKHFGGDPEKVTLMGQSAGAASVHLHLLSNKTREYFQAGVAISGGVFQNWALQSPSSGRALTNRLARIAGCPTKDSQQLVHCFRHMNPHLLVGHQLKLFNYLITPPVLFSPVIEAKGPDAFVSDSAEELYGRDEVAKYPLISTLLEDEGYLVVYILKAFGQTTNFRRNFDKYLPVALGYDVLVKDPDSVTQKIRNFYFGTESPETIPIQKIADIGTDRFFSHGHIKNLKSHAQVAPTYSYLFKYRGRYNFGKIFGFWEDEWGLSHIEDIFYFFNSTRYYEGFKKEYPEYKLSQMLINLIGNFASKREPLYTNESGQDVKIWNAVEPKKEVVFLQIDREIKMIDDPFVNRTLFWDSLGLSDTTPFRPRGDRRL